MKKISFNKLLRNIMINGEVNLIRAKANIPSIFKFYR